MRIELEGVDQLLRTLRRLPDRAGIATAGALYAEANQIMRASQQVVPRDTGVLAGSGTVGFPDVRGSRITVQLGYGGAASAYALYIHEGQESWNWNVPGTGPKYLERPVLQAASGMARRLADRIERNLT